ncbi:MAG TPA: hypothetical protein VIK86_02280 [Candidatus Paceibacterota bacterium]
MAENKNVVEMLGEYLASLSELIKKWSIWGLDLKKLLHVLHQLRKDDFIGLIEKTHKIEKIHLYNSEKKNPEFKILIDLGIITVPDDYVDETCISDFSKKFHREVFVANLVSDENLKESCGIKINPGDRFHVYIYEFVTDYLSVSSNNIRNFLKKNGFVLLESKGVALAYSQKSELIPKSRDYYYSFGKSGYYPIWLNFQSKIFFLAGASIDGDHDKGSVFFAFLPVKD